MHERTRIERDLLGERELPADSLYGIHTLRAIENFAITGVPVSRHPALVRALAAVKRAAARANCHFGVLDGQRADAVERACEEIRGGAHHEWFAVDVLQGGAGTSTNMNANEVIANRGLQLLSCEPGDYGQLHPLEHVNASQSTNDVCPTALKLALIESAERLADALGHLEAAFGMKAREFAGILKTGRTQLQDAVPMTLGQEFHAWEVMVGEDRLRLADVMLLLAEINLGGTATGTGINAPPGYAERVCAELSELTGRSLISAADLIEATQDAGVYVTVSGTLKRVAVKLSKICNDLRLLASGPRSGFGELVLPPVQAGSSIMPGKVNPVVPEAVNQVAFHVVGTDVAVSFAVEGGQLELNAFGPLIAHELLTSSEYLAAAAMVLADRCVRGILSGPALAAGIAADSTGLATALNPLIGYAAATNVASEALASGRSVAEIVLARGLLTREEVETALDLSRMAGRGAARRGSAA